tara:strand:+ start:4190 stop:4693 length:504 start_codon:yes stop_codon:yes gene_type:complete
MMHTIRTCVLMLLGVLLASCSTSSERDPIELPEQRPSDFTLGIVVFGDPDAETIETRSARYIIEPDGTLRASFGEGSDGLTYPPITRRVDGSTLDAIWDRVRSMDVEGGDWRFVQAPEQFHAEMGSNRGYLLEVRSDVSFGAWSTGMDTQSMRTLTQELASLAWVTD